ncbi:MAG: hypothetical protein NC311_04500 [Muribaculaceae bacterium]|nr:hypothetical protein [Muribaculaceae bacterium]
MKTKILIASALVTTPIAATANLRVTANSALGTQCYSESSLMHVGKCVLSESAPLGIQQCPQNWADIDYNEGDERHCYLADQGTTVIICSTDMDADIYEYNETACEEIFGNIYTDLGNNRLMLQISGGNGYKGEPWTGYINVHMYGTEYGCAENYYPSNGKLDASIVCATCPSGGKSNYFNTAITGCYIPAGTSFSDVPGSGTYTADCYY